MAKELRFRLPIIGAELEVDLPIAGGKGSLAGLMPPAKRLSAAAMGHSEQLWRARGRKVTCKPGCSACCYQLIPVSIPEIVALASALSKLPPAKQTTIKKRFASTLARLEAAGLIQEKGEGARTAMFSREGGDASAKWEDVNKAYYKLDLACPFLENDRCAVYDDRPFVCREYMVVSDPALCEELEPSVVPLPRPTYMTRALADAAEQLEGHHPPVIPLPLMLEWLEVHKAELSSDHPSEEALELFLSSIEWNVEEL